MNMKMWVWYVITVWGNGNGPGMEMEMEWEWKCGNGNGKRNEDLKMIDEMKNEVWELKWQHETKNDKINLMVSNKNKAIELSFWFLSSIPKVPKHTIPESGS